MSSSINVASLTSVVVQLRAVEPPVAMMVAFGLMICVVPFCVETMATVPGFGERRASLASSSRRAVKGGAGTTKEPFNNRF